MTVRVQYRLPGAGYRLAFVARAEDGTVWLLATLLPTDPHLVTYPEGEEVRCEHGRRCVRRGWGLAIADPSEGTAEGTYQVLTESRPASTRH